MEMRTCSLPARLVTHDPTCDVRVGACALDQPRWHTSHARSSHAALDDWSLPPAAELDDAEVTLVSTFASFIF